MSRKSVGLILSSQYILPSQVAEFGRIPPSFLCLANRRLYEWQIQTFTGCADSIYISLPDDFKIEEFDRRALAKNKVEIAWMPANYSLGKTIQKLLAFLSKFEDVWILYGDTLLDNFNELPLHSVSIGFVEEYASWGYCVNTANNSISFSENYDQNGGDRKPVISGGFHLDKHILEAALTNNNGNYISALEEYSSKTVTKFKIKELRWHDFGHIHSAFRSRQEFTTQRSFNALKIDPRKVSKYSNDTIKMEAEASWYESVPKKLNIFLPNYLGYCHNDVMLGYSTEYLYLNPISDLFVFALLPEYVWRQIFSACDEFLRACQQYKTCNIEKNNTLNWLYKEKTMCRLCKFSSDENISLERSWVYNGRKKPSLNAIFLHVLNFITNAPNDDFCIVHGDFHFANIFFDFRSLSVKVVDPRGLVNDQQTIYGDKRYDVAKIAHSVNGLYDFIIAGIIQAKVDKIKYEIIFDFTLPSQVNKAQNIFNTTSMGGFISNSLEIKAIVIILFLSMLPLHADNKSRQDTLLANVFRLYEDFVTTQPSYQA